MITKDMRVSEVLDYDAATGEILERSGLPCTGCSAAGNETLAEAAEAHGVNLDRLLDRLNDAIEGNRRTDEF